MKFGRNVLHINNAAQSLLRLHWSTAARQCRLQWYLAASLLHMMSLGRRMCYSTWYIVHSYLLDQVLIPYHSQSHLVPLLVVLLLVGANSSKKPKDLSFQIRSRWNLAEMSFINWWVGFFSQDVILSIWRPWHHVTQKVNDMPHMASECSMLDIQQGAAYYCTVHMQQW